MAMARTIQAPKRSVLTETKPPALGVAKFLSTPLLLSMNHDNNAIPPFAVASQNLAKIGSLTIERFLQSPTEIQEFDVPYDAQENHLETSPTPPPTMLPTTKQLTKADSPSKLHCVSQLLHTCQRVFGKTDLLKYEFIEVDGPNTKRCILTITRPNGSRRSYTTPTVYSRRNEAKSQTAALAVEMGAIDFITTGDMDPSKIKKGLVLAPLDAHDGTLSREGDHVLPPDPEDPAVKEIEDCCIQWRAGRVKPYWIALNEIKFKSRQCCALRIELSPHSLRVYSSEPKYDTVAEGKAACAKVALDQGVLEYIKYGNGQTEPEKPATASSDNQTDPQELETKVIFTPPSPLTLQSFYETFPQPFPEDFGDKTAAEINAPSWLNTMIQSARGGKLSTNYIWSTNGTSWGGNLGLQGCLLRIERPQESRSYLVDARFSKRTDAKAAVCLQAIFQGVGDYIRSVTREMVDKITPTMKRWANDMIFPTLGSECHKIEPGMHPRYDFQKEKDAYGCTVTLELKKFPTPDETKTYSVSTDYRSKADAKIAVACLAAEQGAIEFLRFRGGPLPSGYQTFHSTFLDGTADISNKRKDRDTDGLQERKKSKVELKEGERPVPLLETKEEAMARISAERSSRHSRTREKKKGSNSWKKPCAPGSGGLGAISRPAQGSSIGQNRPRNRSVSNTPNPHQGGGPQPQLPSGPSMAGPVMPGVHGNRHPFPPAPQEHPAQVEPQQNHLVPSHSVPPYPQVGPYPPTSFIHTTPSSGYYPPHGSNILYGQPVVPQQYQGGGPALAPPYPYLGAQFPQPSHYPPLPVSPHVYQPQYSPHSYSGGHPPVGPTGPLPAMVSSYVPGYENAPYVDNLPGQPSYSLHNHHHPQSPPVDVSAQTHGTNGSMKDLATETSANAKQLHEDAQLKVIPAPPPKSHVASLFDYCSKEGVSSPKFHQKVVTDDEGKVTHKVWVIMGNEKLELPVTFTTVNEGRERVAKQVLGRLRSKRKANK